MNKLFTVLLVCASTICATAQKKAEKLLPTQPFGKIDKADLELKKCDFETDANAEVLFDKGSLTLSYDYGLSFERHIRIKIFNEKAKDLANIRLRYFSYFQEEKITGLQAQTINLNNGNIEITKVDSKLIYKKTVDKLRSEYVFAFPNVQPGSVIEYKYTIMTKSIADIPNWYFQTDIPTRYSEIDTDLPQILHYKTLQMVKLDMAENTEKVKAMANLPSLREEPFMTSKRDNSERIYYELSSIDGVYQNFATDWKGVGEKVLEFDDFGGQFKRKLAGEDVILAKAKTMKHDADKIAYIFNEVKTRMKWNGEDERYTDDGTSMAWDKRTGNSTEVNLILYHLLMKAGLDVYPMLVSTQENGKINPAYPSIYQFNKTVAYIPIDSANFYIMDATNKFAEPKTVPADLLNSYGLYIDKENAKYELAFIRQEQPITQFIMINADIKPDGKMNGSAQVSSTGYNKINALKRFNTDGEKKYMDYLREDDNALKISSIKLQNSEQDSTILSQNINFDLDLNGSDENYIYFNSNIFTSMHKNPFLSELRTTDISFGYPQNFFVTGTYKIPTGYKLDATPKNITLVMPDKSISFKRFVAEQDGTVVVRYTITRKSTLVFKESYPEIHEFYKQMHEMLSEQIVLKKS